MKLVDCPIFVHLLIVYKSGLTLLCYDEKNWYIVPGIACNLTGNGG